MSLFEIGHLRGRGRPCGGGNNRAGAGGEGGDPTGKCLGKSRASSGDMVAILIGVSRVLIEPR